MISWVVVKWYGMAEGSKEISHFSARTLVDETALGKENNWMSSWMYVKQVGCEHLTMSNENNQHQQHHYHYQYSPKSAKKVDEWSESPYAPSQSFGPCHVHNCAGTSKAPGQIQNQDPTVSSKSRLPSVQEERNASIYQSPTNYCTYRWLVKEQIQRAGQHLKGHGETTLLTSRQATLEQSSD